MSINIGGVDLFRQGLENEHRIIVLEKIVEKLLRQNAVTQEEIDKIKEEAIEILSKKYPAAGITKGGENDKK